VTRFTPIFSDPATLAKVLTLGIFTTIRAVDQKDLTPVLISFGKIALGVVLKAIPRLIEYIALEIGAFAALEAAPIIGWSIKVCRIGAALAEIGQTVAEVTSGPAVFENMVEFSMATTVSIKHDPGNFQFPATATHYVVTITFAKGVSQQIPGTMPPGTVTKPIKEVFTDTPVGGEAKIDVWFFTANNWLVGQGSFGPYANFPNDPTGSFREFEIEERLVPLTDKTQYSHKQKLGLTSSGAHVWTAPAPAPHQTAVDLNCDTDSLCELDGITVSQTSAAAAYTWRAVGNVPLCGDGPTNTPTPPSAEHLDRARSGRGAADRQLRIHGEAARRLRAAECTRVVTAELLSRPVQRRFSPARRRSRRHNPLRPDDEAQLGGVQSVHRLDGGASRRVRAGRQYRATSTRDHRTAHATTAR
jgi:hypothetical protein